MRLRSTVLVWVAVLGSSCLVFGCDGDPTSIENRDAQSTDSPSCSVKTPSGFTNCGDINCPGNSCCLSPEASGFACFGACPGANGSCPPASSTCVAEGSCTSAADCQGALPHVCRLCAGTSGETSEGCAHWACTAGRCEPAYCDSNLLCGGGRNGCLPYYLPPVERSCTVDQDCVVVRHVESCCVSVLIAVQARANSVFYAYERACSATLDFPCSCPGETVTEDGGRFFGSEPVQPTCVAGTCRALPMPSMGGDAGFDVEAGDDSAL
jgi:hypothetical protein